MTEIQRLSEGALDEAVKVWNEAFAQYAVDVKMSVKTFADRFTREGLSPKYSFMAQVNNEIAGLVLNGIKVMDGKKTAWNGGTGVSPRYRGKGIGKLLMERTLELYRSEGVDVATLEVLVNNDPAIFLYEQWGYRRVKRLWSLWNEAPENNPVANLPSYRVIHGTACDAKDLSFYNRHVAWSSRAENIHDGESIRLVDENNQVAAYALYHRIRREGKPDILSLCQCEVSPDRPDVERWISAVLKEFYNQADDPVIFRVPDFTSRTASVIPMLQEHGFRVTAERYLMNLYF